MEKVGFLPLFLLILNFPGLAFADHDSARLNAGRPGCVSAIQGKVITDDEAKSLTEECQAFRNSYLYGLHVFSEDPKKLSTEIREAIHESVAKRSARPPYDALLLALYTQDAAAKKEIQERAEFERKTKPIYAYGDALLERLETGKCAHFKLPGYQEICKSRDLLFEHLIEIQSVKGKGTS